MRTAAGLDGLKALFCVVLVCIGMGAVGASHSIAARPDSTDYEALVDTRYGVMTPAKEVVSGRCLLGPCRPNGSIQPGPDTLYPEWSKWKYPSPSSFHPSDEVSGFSQLHAHGTGGWPSYGLFLLSPTTANVSEEVDLASPMTVEVARPSYFRGRLDRWGVDTEITSGRRAAMYRFTFPVNGRRRLVVNCRRKNGERQGLKKGGLTVAGATVKGGGRYHHNWNPAEYDCYFAAAFSPAPIASGTSADGAVAWLEFDASEVRTKIGVSFKSAERAAEYLAAEIPQWDFDACRQAAAADWNRELGRVEATGFACVDDARVFYSNLYHAMISPRDRTGDVAGWSDTEAFWDDHYTLWDTWKTVFPMMSIIAPERYVSMVNSFGTRLKHNGECAASFIQTKDYRTGQSGDDVDNVIAEAWAKQVPGIDWTSVAEVLRFHAAERTEDYREKGWVCSDVKHPKYCYRFASGSGTLGFAYNDWCAARVFEGLGERELAAKLFARSHNWTNVWDDAVVDEPSGFRGFARGKASDGRWVAGDRMAKGCPVGEYPPRRGFNSYFYECTSFEASFTIMNDIPGMIAKMGGKDLFIRRLEYALENRLIEFGNEPSFMTIWLFDFAGRPDLAAKWAAKLRSRFGFDGRSGWANGWGIPGDDDSGAMGALAVFLVSGFYPIAGTDLYALHGPAAKEIVFDVGGGRTFTVKAPGFAAGRVGYDRTVLNGAELKEPFIRHGDIVKGGVLEFEMKADDHKEKQK